MEYSQFVELEEWTNLCIDHEKSRNLSPNSITELTRYFSKFIEYAKEQSIFDKDQLNPSFFTDFLSSKSTGTNAPHIKALVWSLKKLGNFLFIKQIFIKNPTSHLKHPKISKRSKIPEYLTENNLLKFLTKASKLSLMDFCIISLISTLGLRPHAVEGLKHEDVLPFQRLIKIKIKGGWYKRMPLSSHMTELLKKWLHIHNKKSEYLFYRKNKSTVSKDYIRMIVKKAGEHAKIEFKVTPRHLRHTFATFSADRHSKNLTCALMGHSFTRTTEIYTHLAPTKFRRIMLAHPYNTFTQRGKKN